MILVDYRDGSKELIEPLLARGLPVVKDHLDAADVAFVGRGVAGRPLLVGIEHKKVEDLMQSLRTNRMNAQAEKMIDNGMDIRLLFIVGSQRFDKQGRMLKRVGRAAFRPIPGIGHGELMKRLYTLQFCTGLSWQWFEYASGAIRAIELLYRTLTDKDLDQHTSHLAPYEPGRIVPMSQMRRTLSTLPGISRQFSKAAETKFVTLKRAFLADQAAWAALEATDDHDRKRRLGDKTAERVIEAIDPIPF